MFSSVSGMGGMSLLAPGRGACFQAFPSQSIPLSCEFSSVQKRHSSWFAVLRFTPFSLLIFVAPLNG